MSNSANQTKPQGFSKSGAARGPKGYAYDECPDRNRLHTKAPKGYLAWHEWAEQKSKTHVQKRCPTCGLLCIWIPRAAVKRAKPQ